MNPADSPYPDPDDTSSVGEIMQPTYEYGGVVYESHWIEKYRKGIFRHPLEERQRRWDSMSALEVGFYLGKRS